MPKSFEYSDDTQNGILRYFYDNYNSQYESIVKVYSTSDYTGNTPFMAIDFNLATFWHAQEFLPFGEYFVIYLKDFYIRLSGYSVMTSNVGTASYVCHMKNWGFDASNDNKTWVHQVNITDDSSLNVGSGKKYFGWKHGTYKYFRIMTTGHQYDNMQKNAFDLAQIELFGTLMRNIRDMCVSCNCKKRVDFSILSFLIVVEK